MNYCSGQYSLTKLNFTKVRFWSSFSERIMKSFFNKWKKLSGAGVILLYLCYFVTAIYCHCIDQGSHHYQVTSKNEAPHAHQDCHSSSEKSSSSQHPLCDCNQFETAALTSSSQSEISKIYTSLIFLQPFISSISFISSPQREWQTLGFHGPPGQTPLYITHQSFLI